MKLNSPRAATPDSWREGFGVIARILRLTFEHPWQVTFAIGGAMVAAILQLMIPKLLGHAVDQTQAIVDGGGVTRASLWVTAALLLVVSVLRGGFTMVQNYFAEAVGHHVAYRLRLSYYEKIQRLSFSFHDQVHSGDLITVGMLDLEGVRMFFSTGFVRAAFLAMMIGIGAFLLLTTNFVLGLLALSFVPFVAWRSSAARLKLRAAWLTLQEWLGVLTRAMDENLSGIRVVRAFAAQRHEMAKFDKLSQHTLGLQYERIGIRVRNTSMMTFSFFIAMGLVLLVGGQKVIAGEITVGTLTSFLAFMTILQLPVRQLGMMVNSFARASTCGARLFEVLDLNDEIGEAGDAPELAVGDGTLEFEAVDFAYPAAPDKPVLKGISFTAHRGQTIGIVGPPGSGKTSVASLLPRFYDVTGGSIRIDGRDIRSVALASLRRAVGVVQQDSFLFTTTIENNIAYGDPWAEGATIERASESAQLHTYIKNLPQGYSTLVGERGVSLSGGQRQRLSIARILMLKPPFIVFDDSTAAIDAATEQRIRAEMREVAGDSVTLIIAHRLSSLKHADEILFLEDGEVVERGTHDELIALGGRYKALSDLQGQPDDADLEDTKDDRDVENERHAVRQG
nr:ABC transporter ATP-binding protein [Pararhizobium mangrovi]